jgi:ankyrin repeat protein
VNDDGDPMPVVRAARRAGRGPKIVELLVRHGAEPGGDDDPVALVGAAGVGNTAEVERLLDLGFPVGTRADDGGTALHAASYAGSAPTVRLLLDRGGDLEARDTTWNSTPLGWAMVGSGERPSSDPAADWVATVRMLLEAGASTDEVTLDPDDPKPPSPEVAELLRVSRRAGAPPR